MTCWAGWSTVGIKIARRNISNYADDTILMAESEEELKRFLMKVKEESQKAGLKLNIQKAKFMASATITSWQIDGKTMETVTNFLFLDSQITADGDCSHEIKRCLLLGRKAMTNLDSVFSSVQFSSVSHVWLFRPHESQHARPPCPSPTPGVYSNSYPLSQWCHPAISSSVVPFSSCPQSLSASGSFPMSQLWAWGGQSIGVSASASVLPMNTQDWPSGCTGWISLQSKGLSRIFSNTIVQKHQFFSAQLSSQSNSHIHTWPRKKTIALTRWTFVGKVMSLLFNMLFRLVITLLWRSKHLLISGLQSPSAVILEPPKNKVWHCFHCLPIYFPWSDGTRS